jgi:hypothetical protein
MRRRIEITIYRRATVVFRDQSGEKSSPSEPVPPVSAHSEKQKNGVAQLTTFDVARSPELMLLIEALVRNDGSSNCAARDPGLSPSDFVSRLCRFGFGRKQ